MGFGIVLGIVAIALLFMVISIAQTNVRRDKVLSRANHRSGEAARAVMLGQYNAH